MHRLMSSNKLFFISDFCVATLIVAYSLVLRYIYFTSPEKKCVVSYSYSILVKISRHCGLKSYFSVIRCEAFLNKYDEI